MIEELNGECLNVCVCFDKAPLYVAHCLQLGLIGEGATLDEAIRRLKQIIAIKVRISQEMGTELWADNVDSQWCDLHRQTWQPSCEEIDVVLPAYEGPDNEQVISVPVKIDKKLRCIRNKNSWPSSSLSQLETVLHGSSIRFRTLPQEPGYGYFVGHWPAGTNGPVLTYPLHVPDSRYIKWFHVRSIARLFWIEDLHLKLQHTGDIQK